MRDLQEIIIFKKLSGRVGKPETDWLVIKMRLVQ